MGLQASWQAGSAEKSTRRCQLLIIILHALCALFHGIFVCCNMRSSSPSAGGEICVAHCKAFVKSSTPLSCLHGVCGCSWWVNTSPKMPMWCSLDTRCVNAESALNSSAGHRCCWSRGSTAKLPWADHETPLTPIPHATWDNQWRSCHVVSPRRGWGQALHGQHAPWQWQPCCEPCHATICWWGTTWDCPSVLPAAAAAAHPEQDAAVHGQCPEAAADAQHRCTLLPQLQS